MTSKQFFFLIAELRDKQKEYFRTRKSDVLSECKRLESEADREIYRVKSILYAKEYNERKSKQ